MRSHLRLCLTVSLVALVMVEPGRAAAAPIPTGAPLDGKNHTVTIDEGASENLPATLMSPQFPVQINPAPDNKILVNDVNNVLSDTLFFATDANGKTTIALTSDTGGVDTEMGAELNELKVVTNPNDGFSVTYVVTSAAEPEPSSLTLLGIGAAGLLAYMGRKRMAILLKVKRRAA
jgi:hypothetical protein